MKTLKSNVAWRFAAIALVILFSGGHTFAAAPQLKTQVPGWFRLMVGSFEVTALRDGNFDLPTKVLKHTTPKETAKAMEQAFLKQGETIPTSVNAFLINTGEKLVLIDTGAAKQFGPAMGLVLENLKASGYDPAQVDLVLLTHLHGDHASGVLTADGKIAFPNAQVLTLADEANFWLDKDKAAKANPDLAPFFQMAMTAVAPYKTAEKLGTFKINTEVVPGIHAVPTAVGHTPGSVGFLVESNGEKLLVTGDVIHVGAMQFAHPEISVAFDIDDKLAIPARKKLFATAAKEKTLLAFSHIAFPGIGHLRAEGHGYVWVPIAYGAVK